MSKGTPGVRYAEVERETTETRVQVVLDLDGGSRRDISTGIPFLDHMVQLMAFHGHINLGISAEGDTEVDDHHTVEDVGISLGRAIRNALTDSEDIVRYASNHTPMDDALILVALDICGRGNLCFNVDFHREKLGDLSTENVAEFFKAVAIHAGANIHVHKVCGSNDHHVCEAIFKGFGLALHQATRHNERRGVVPSTKGKID
ncbi:MAG: Imidazoleglycerol-phosphate dehydratase [Fimbriimonadaceae bacterium]|nr:Imidazoleglycerol-phosphate dehydratase [Fimbriimonadaceae bacterium]